MSVLLSALNLGSVPHLVSRAAGRAASVRRLVLIAALLAAATVLAAGDTLANGDCEPGDDDGAVAEPQIVARAAEISIPQPTASVPLDRDITLDLPFISRDRHGYRTLPPLGQLDITVTGPDGEQVDKERISVSQPKGEDGYAQIRVTIMGAEQPLPPGRYTVRAQYGDLVAEFQFDVAGPPATIQLRVDANTSYYVRSSVLTVTATVLDANGVIVPDGAEVDFTVEGDLAVRNVASHTDETTTSGEASARYIITGDAGTATFSAKSGEASGSVLVELGASRPRSARSRRPKPSPNRRPARPRSPRPRPGRGAGHRPPKRPPRCCTPSWRSTA